jgi:hypothetical protein
MAQLSNLETQGLKTKMLRLAKARLLVSALVSGLALAWELGLMLVKGWDLAMQKQLGSEKPTRQMNQI